jgi:hypothetical protein
MNIYHLAGNKITNIYHEKNVDPKSPYAFLAFLSSI